MEIGGKPILHLKSVEAFDAVGDIGLIVIVCPAERQGELPEQGRRPLSFATPIVSRRGGLHASGISVFPALSWCPRSSSTWSCTTAPVRSSRPT